VLWVQSLNPGGKEQRKGERKGEREKEREKGRGRGTTGERGREGKCNSRGEGSGGDLKDRKLYVTYWALVVKGGGGGGAAPTVISYALTAPRWSGLALYPWTCGGVAHPRK